MNPKHSLKTLICCGILATISIIAPTTQSQADQVYRWEDENGVVHYSSEPQTHNDQPADLPRITRGRLGLQAQAQQSCNDHGDIDCQAGPDLDGSVICADSFRDASARFRLHCNTPKLSVTDISDPKQGGKFSIIVRNSKAVAANNPELILKVNQFGIGIILKGPSTIEPFEVGEFIYNPTEHGELSAKLTAEQITVTCDNCD